MKSRDAMRPSGSTAGATRRLDGHAGRAGGAGNEPELRGRRPATAAAPCQHRLPRSSSTRSTTTSSTRRLILPQGAVGTAARRPGHLGAGAERRRVRARRLEPGARPGELRRCAHQGFRAPVRLAHRVEVVGGNGADAPARRGPRHGPRAEHRGRHAGSGLLAEARLLVAGRRATGSSPSCTSSASRRGCRRSTSRTGGPAPRARGRTSGTSSTTARPSGDGCRQARTAWRATRMTCSPRRVRPLPRCRIACSARPRRRRSIPPSTATRPSPSAADSASARSTRSCSSFENLTDENYRGIAWGLDAPGRGFSIGYTARF